MNNRQIALLLVVPAVAMIAKSHARRHMWAGMAGDDADESVRGFGGGAPHWAGHGPRHLGGRFQPRLKALFDEWHRAAHAESGGSATADATV